MKKKSSKKNHKGVKRIVCAAIVVVALLVGGFSAYSLFSPNVRTGGDAHKCLLVYENASYDDVLDSLRSMNALRSELSFRFVSRLLNYPGNVVSGRYELIDGENSLSFVHKLMYGKQSPVRLTFNNIRTKKDLADKVTKNLRMTQSDMLTALCDQDICAKYGTNPENIVSLFIPNTYEVYWDISPEDLILRMKKEYDKFWTNERLDKLAEVGLNQQQVSTLASIVDEETRKADEKPRVAGLYLNRYHRGIPLQADPTVKFALQNFSLKRIYKGHLEYDSPYNTYKYVGLPPGPIRIPSIEAIDAVLNFENHDYIYMCAKEDFSGYHNFAATYEAHQANANKYRKALNKRGIR